MAIRTAQERPGISWNPQILASTSLDRTARRRDDPAPAETLNPLPALALILSVLGCVVLYAVGFLAGRTAERGSQLGQVLALAPERDSVESALAWARTLQSRLAALQPRATRPANRATLPPAPSVPSALPRLPLPQIHP